VLTIASCSNLVSVKRVDRMIDALSQYGGRVHWIHFGDGPLKEELEAQARKLPGNIGWRFAGARPNGEIMEFYRTNYIDVFVNVSESEGVPVSIMEALSFGIPVVATDVGGTHEIVEDGENGLLLKPDFEADELMKAVNAVVEMGENCRRRAREIWQEKCDAEKNYREFYQQIVELEA